MIKFIEDYKKWDTLSNVERKEILKDCVAFYDEKTVSYIISGLPASKKTNFKKDPVKVTFTVTETAGQKINFGDNSVFILNSVLTEDKKNVFYNVSKCTICAVFLNLFNNTANDPNKKTKFGQIANGFMASITSEFAKNQAFEQDMMQACEQLLGQAVEATISE